MATRARSNAGHWPHVRRTYAIGMGMGAKFKRRKGRYLPGFSGRGKEARTRFNRDERHRTRAELKRFA